MQAPDKLRQTPALLTSQHMPLLGDYALQPVIKRTQAILVLWVVLNSIKPATATIYRSYLA